jgi:hypothetical protein
VQTDAAAEHRHELLPVELERVCIFDIVVVGMSDV